MRLALYALVAAAMAACGGRESPSYLSSTERRSICHLRYRAGDWRGEDLEIPLWMVYEDHIGMHPKDYWGRCEPEDIKPYQDPNEPEPAPVELKSRRVNKKP